MVCHGALIVSLDFELHWGVRDTQPVDGPYRAHLLGAREAVRRMLDVFHQFDIAATWATVGMLFARDRDEWLAYSPAIRPNYRRPCDDPYTERLGSNERDDPFHYAHSLIKEIRACPRQEIGTHTFSHYYCLDASHTLEAFRADIDSAVRIAASQGLTLRSIVLPRMQVLPECLTVIRDFGIPCWRAPERSWMYQTGSTAEMRTPQRRIARLADAYLSLAGPETADWNNLARADGTISLPQSRFLRPYSRRFAALEPWRLDRITNAMRHAATNRRQFHLCWHPHNFGVNLAENIAFLKLVLQAHRRLNDEFGFVSMNMWQAAQLVLPPQFSTPAQDRKE